MDEVLGAIADAVSYLVIAFADSEEKNTLFGDMVPAAQVIQGAVQGMIDAAEQTKAIIDKEYIAELDSTAAELKQTSQKLVDEAQNVRDNPYDRKPQREAIKAAKNLLQKVTSLVLIEEMGNIKTLVVIAKRVGDTTRRLNEADQEEQGRILMEEITMSSDELIKRVSKRAHGSQNEELKQGLLSSCNDLNTSIATHHEYAKAFIADYSDQRALSERNTWSGIVLENLDELIEGVKIMFSENSKFVDAAFKWQPIRTIAEEEVLKARGDLVSLLSSLQKAIQDGQGAARARAIVQAAQRELENAMAVAEKEKDPIKKNIILQGIAALKKATPALVAAIKASIENPTDYANQVRLEGATRETHNLAEGLANAVSLTPAQAVAINGNRLVHDLETLAEAARTGDKLTANAILSYIGDAFDRHVQMAEAYAESITDPNRKAEVMAAIKKLKDVKHPLIAAAKNAVETNTPEAHKKLAQLVAEAKDAIYAISRAHEMVSAVGKQLVYDLDELARIIERNDANMHHDVLAYAKNIAENAQRQIEAAEEYSSKLRNPARKQEIASAIGKLRTEAGRLQDAIRAFLANPNDKARKQQLERLIQSTKEASENLSRVTQPTADDHAEMRAAYSKSSGLEFDTANSGPVNQAVMDAAQMMASAVRDKAKDDTPLGRLIAFSEGIAQDMALLSQYAAQGNKKEMILAARRIADAVKQVVSNSQKVAAECKDPVLKTAVMTYANAANNYGTQLKIICAVKAASDENDPTAEAQLITCSQGLCDGVVGAVKSAESATVATPRAGATPRGGGNTPRSAAGTPRSAASTPRGATTTTPRKW